MAERANWEMEQGARFQRTLTYKDDNGNAIDLTGYSVRMDIRERKDKTSPIIHDVDAAGQITITDATGGEITIDIPDSDTAGFSFGVGWYDVEIVDGSGNVTRLVQGRINLDREVTD